MVNLCLPIPTGLFLWLLHLFGKKKVKQANNERKAPCVQVANATKSVKMG